MKRTLAGALAAAAFLSLLILPVQPAHADSAWYAARFDEIASSDLALRAETIYSLHAPATYGQSKGSYYPFYLDKMAERVVNNTARRGEMSCYKVAGWMMAKKADEWSSSALKKTTDYARYAFKAINRSRTTKWMNYHFTVLDKGSSWAIQTGHMTWARKNVSYGIRDGYSVSDCYHNY